MSEMDGIRVLYPPEILTVGSAQALVQQVSECHAIGTQIIVLELQNVSCIDSSGLGVLLSLYVKTRSMGGEICLCSPNQQVRYLLSLTDMGRIFEIFDNQAALYAAKLGDRAAVPLSAQRQGFDRDRLN
jgi:anti-anti-sigma factor